MKFNWFIESSSLPFLLVAQARRRKIISLYSILSYATSIKTVSPLKTHLCCRYLYFSITGSSREWRKVKEWFEIQSSHTEYIGVVEDEKKLKNVTILNIFPWHIFVVVATAAVWSKDSCIFFLLPRLCAFCLFISSTGF